MADLHVRTTTHVAQELAAARPDAHGRRDERAPQDRPDDQHRQPQGAEELAVALHLDRPAEIEARYETDHDGAPRIRIIDRRRNETVAVLTPEELRTLAESTGLPPGLLVRKAS